MTVQKRLYIFLAAVVFAGMMFLIPFFSVRSFAAENSMGGGESEAKELAIEITRGQERVTSRLTDSSYSTVEAFSAGDTLTVTAADSSEKIYGLYIVWARRPGQWTLSCENGEIRCGEYGFLHEYVPIEEGCSEAVISFSQDEKICCMKAYSEGKLPVDVQVWEPECDRADFLLFSTHADDEILFFGGILPEYAGERDLRVQLVYFSNYFDGTVIREHEKLDGLWACGVKNYPVNGPFPDQYAETLEQAKKIYSYEDTLGFLVEQIRKFRPQVCIAQDTGGEYGHGAHQLTSAAMREAVTVSMDAEYFPESADEYGVWDVPKTYIHLYEENPITLNCRVPLDAFGGQTALEVATEAYKKHVSQQWCWFYVSDTYEYSIAEYGLCRTTVGADTGGDMMENLVSYAEQERMEEEAKRAEEEAKKAEEEARKAQEEAQRRAEEEKRAQEEALRMQDEARRAQEEAQAAAGIAMRRKLFAVVGIVAAALFLSMLIWKARTVRK